MRAVQCTGHSRRSRLNSSCGGPSSHCSRSVTSTSSSGTGPRSRSRGSVSHGREARLDDPSAHSDCAREPSVSDLPQLDGGLFLTDGGIETTLIFHEGLDLPEFAAFDLLDATTPARRRCGATSSATRRSRAITARGSSSRARPGGRTRAGPSGSATRARSWTRSTAGRSRSWPSSGTSHAGDSAPIVISGCIGPHADGYRPDRDPHRATRRRSTTRCRSGPSRTPRGHGHRDHDDLRRGGGRASRARPPAAGLPAAISFTVETDGRLPSGQDARRTRSARSTRRRRAHLRTTWSTAPTRRTSRRVLGTGEPWERARSAGLRANASTTAATPSWTRPRSSTTGDPAELGARYAELAGEAAVRSTCSAAAAAPIIRSRDGRCASLRRARLGAVRTAVTELLGIEHPVLQAPMASVATPELAAAVSAAGGLGGLGSAMLPVDELRRQTATVRAATDRPFQLNFFCHQPPAVDPDAARAARTPGRTALRPARARRAARALHASDQLRRGTTRGAARTGPAGGQLPLRPARRPGRSPPAATAA